MACLEGTTNDPSIQETS